jgi:hypothetical protein
LGGVPMCDFGRLSVASKGGIGMALSLFQAIFTHCTRCWGPTFSDTELRPK